MRLEIHLLDFSDPAPGAAAVSPTETHVETEPNRLATLVTAGLIAFPGQTVALVRQLRHHLNYSQLGSLSLFPLPHANLPVPWGALGSVDAC